MEGLTARQLEIARLVVEGLTLDEIADRLSITHSTARQHTREIRLKLGVQKKRQIPEALRQHGYI